MSDPKITVRIDSSRPIFVEADASSFGQIFAGLNDHEQVDVLRSMVEHMKPHRMQWDYIAIALEKDENRDVRDDLSVIFPATNTMLERIAALEAENEALRSELEADKAGQMVAIGKLGGIEDAVDALRAENERLRKALEASRDVHAGLAEFILKRPEKANSGLTKEQAKGVFADLQRARLAADAALEAKP